MRVANRFSTRKHPGVRLMNMARICTLVLSLFVVLGLSQVAIGAILAIDGFAEAGARGFGSGIGDGERKEIPLEVLVASDNQSLDASRIAHGIYEDGGALARAEVSVHAAVGELGIRVVGIADASDGPVDLGRASATAFASAATLRKSPTAFH